MGLGLSGKQNDTYKYNVALGKQGNASTVNKFGYNLDIDTGAEEIIAAWSGTFDPLTDVMTSAQTFTISYTNTGDGSTATGARSLLFTYLDGNFESQTGIHTLGSTGSDVTSFSGLGVNRCVVLSTGGDAYNNNDITITATTDGTTQALIPAQFSVTQQCIFHTQVNHTLLTDWLRFSVQKISGGSSPRVTLYGYSWSRVTSCRYEIYREIIDTSVENSLELRPSQPFVLTGREVLYFTAETDTNNTAVSCRFSGIEVAS